MTSLDFKNYSKNLRIIIWSFLQDIMTWMALHLVAYSGLFGSTTIVTESPKKVNVNHKLGQVSEVVG